jgi:predicted restriction endonuclease
MGCVAQRLVAEVQCSGHLDAHHVLMRSQGGQDTVQNLKMLCRAHHDWVHRHPAKSYDLDLLRRRS